MKNMDEKYLNELFSYYQFIIDKKFPFPSFLDKKFKGLLILACSGMTIFYGMDYFDSIFQTLYKTEIHYYKTKLSPHIMKENISTDFRDQILNNHLKNIPGFVSNYYDSNDEQVHRTIYLSSYRQSILDLLDIMVHEMNHIVNSKENETFFLGDHLTYRTGLCYQVDGQKKYFTLEEIYNTLQVEEIIHIIRQFSSCSIEDKYLTKLVEQISKQSKNGFQSAAYQDISSLVRPLFRNPIFHDFVKTERWNGHLDKIQEQFNYVVGDDVFDTYCSSLDTVNSESFFGEKPIQYIRKCTKLYNSSPRLK